MKKRILLALLSVSASAHAFSPYNIGAQVGLSSIESDSSTTKGLNGSFRFHPFLSAEAGYIEHGNVSAFDGRADASSFYLAAKPTYPMGRVELYAKGGLNYYDTSLHSSQPQASGSQSGIGLMAGVGADLYIMRQFTVGVGLQSFGMQVQNESTRATSLTVNAHYHF